MGAGIAHLAAQNGLPVVVMDTDARALERAQQRIQGLLDKAVAKAKLTAQAAADTWARLAWTTRLGDLAESDVVVEAVFEDLQVKCDLFRQLDELCGEHVLLASNTSSMPITTLAAQTKHPGRVVGMHFFNPPQVMRLVEVVRGLQTSDATVARAKALAEALGKTPVEVKRDTPGFIVNRIMIPQFIEAIRLVEEGVASKEEVDKAVKLGLNYPMGPFELQDFAGVDIGLYVMDYFYNETKDPRYAAPHSLRTLVRAGRLGRKTGRGWYDYDEEGTQR
ncbi:MAG: 3-hydroxyacyl-CoA dehydrogenase family protein [Alicyclobacillus sp.]|nr:3-hydroxyacyl-CoA dehydrogenase family protein [Alicyclobacillus sp.]